MNDETNIYGTYETPSDIAARPVTSFGWGSPHTIGDIRFAMVEGYRPLRMDLHLPPAAADLVPVVVSIHGGGWILGSQKIDSDDTLTIAQMWQALLDRGIAVAAVQYRFSREAIFPAALHDVQAAVRWLNTYGAAVGVDPARIGAFGDSAGGHLSALLAVAPEAPELDGSVGVNGGSARVAAAVAWYPVTDFADLTSSDYDWSADDSMAALLLGGVLASVPGMASVASPITHVHAGSAPLLLQHGDRDDLVPSRQSEALAARYRDLGLPIELEIAAEGDHGFDGADVTAIIERAAEYLAHHLSSRAVGP